MCWRCRLRKGLGLAADVARCLGDWAQILAVSCRLLRARDDRELKIAAARAVAAVLNYHYQPDLGLLLELTNGDFFLFDDDRASYVHGGAALSALSALITEAGQCREEKLMLLAGRYLRQHLEAAWDVEQGGLRDEYNAGAWGAEKSAEGQGEALVALAALIACRSEDWAVAWFERVYAYWLQCGPGESLVRLRHLSCCAASLKMLIEPGGQSQV